MAIDTPLGPGDLTAGDVTVTDEGLATGYQDAWFGHWNRGRGAIVADWDGDGRQDVFSANPASESFLILNRTPPGGPMAFITGQVLGVGNLFYGGVAADLDNDGDADLFVCAGANDGAEPDRVFENVQDQAHATDPLVDISATLPLVPEDPGGNPVPNGTMGARAFDADLDGDLDVWADNFAAADALGALMLVGQNQMYVNDGDIQLHDEARALGLRSVEASRHSSVFDFDNDGDFDVYENNFVGNSIFWRNMLMEYSDLGFIAVTPDLSLFGDLATPYDLSMCSLATDLDNDGWTDLLVLSRAVETPGASEHHGIWMNQQGQGFVDVGAYSNLSDRYGEVSEGSATMDLGMDMGWGVMGCQVGDIDLDGFPDVFIGRGGGNSGGVNHLYVSAWREQVVLPGYGPVVVPQFDDWTDLADFPAPTKVGDPAPPYPERTHGSALVDFDGDGVSELAVHNGGPASSPFAEPNRLYKFHLPDPRFVRIRLVGDGSSVNRDGIGARVTVEVQRDSDGYTWELHQEKLSATGFGAQNEPDLVFGLADGDRVLSIDVLWPDGATQAVEPPEGVRSWITVTR